MDTFENYNIHIKSSPGSNGEVYTICPRCSHDRKKGKQKCLSVNISKGVWRCHHCGWEEGLKPDKDTKAYEKPEWRNATMLSDKVIKYFESRRIRQQTLIELKITEGNQWMPGIEKETSVIEFNYFMDGVLTNIKYRDARKNFKLYKNAKLIFYNIDAIKEEESVYIVEGEIDALSLIEAGIKNVISVPNGANLNKNNLQYVDNCIDKLSHIKEFFLATDNDIAGRKLQDDLSIRFGQEKCFKINFGEYKDANECLVAKGIEGIHATIKTKIPFPIEGVYTIEDISDEIDDLYENGLEKGKRVSILSIDEQASWVKGYITVITGVPSHGKSAFLDFILLRLNLLHGWKGAFYSPENRPLELHYSRMAEMLVGKRWEGYDRISKEELKSTKEFFNRKVWFIKPNKDFTLKSILESVRQLIMRHGIDYFVIDPWNKLEHKYNESETKYIGICLDEIALFCENNKVHGFIVAHPTKLTKDKQTGLYPVATLYDISGSAHFFNKSDIGISIYRDFESNTGTSAYFQKVRFSHWGDGRLAELKYNAVNKRYYDDGAEDNTNWLIQKPIITETLNGTSQPARDFTEPIKTADEYPF